MSTRVISNRDSQALSDFPTRIETFNKADWVYEQSIYKGNNATVYKIRHTKTRVYGVLKKYSKIYLNSKNIEKVKQIFETEIQCIKLLHNSKYTPPLWYYYENTTEMGLVMKYMAQNTLRQYIHTFLCDDCAMAYVIYPLLKGIRNIHFANIIHRDIKPENIFIHKNNIYIGDYGYSYILNTNDKASGVVGTLQYMAPEILKAHLDNNENIQYGKEIDIWAIGVIVYELLYHIKPFGWNEYKSIHYDIRRFISQELSFPYIISDDISDFITKCLDKNPTKRPTIEELLNHNFILNYLKSRYDIHERCLQRQSFLSILTPTKMKKQTLKAVPLFQYKSLKKQTPFWTKICTIS